MNSIPASIEAHLEDAGCSSTEILILKHLLLAGEGMGLRQLSTKTGKSPGALDQSLHRLLQKHIISRTIVNGGPLFAFVSLEPLLAWMQRDLQKKRENLQRRYQDFATFAAQMQLEQKRPDLFHYEGTDGIAKAFAKLTEHSADFLHYVPVRGKEEDDLLRDERVALFRLRHKRGIVARVIAHDTPLGRRYQSRDAFEYRKTLLVPEELYPFPVEKIIAGNFVACFDAKSERVSLLNYPDMASTERALFNGIWNEYAKREGVPAVTVTEEVKAPTGLVSLRMRTFSSVREFLLSRKSLATMAALGILAAILTYGFYLQNIALNTKRIQDMVRSVAATGALQFDAADLDKLRTPEDIKRPEYTKVIYFLNEIRRQNPDIKYAYIMRPTEKPKIFSFIADADSLDPTAKKDLNNDGQIDEKDWLSPPGEPYDEEDATVLTQAMQSGIAVVSVTPYTDQWGTFYTGVAPIKDAHGKTVAVLGIDVVADKVSDFAQRTFVPILYFLGIFLLFLFIRLAAFNRSLWKELCEVLCLRKVATVVCIAAGISLVLTYALYRQNINLNKRRVQDTVRGIAATGALQFSPADLEKLQTSIDVDRPEYTRVVAQLNDIRRKNAHVKFAYIMRPTEDPKHWKFVADADSLHPFVRDDTNGNGTVDPADLPSPPGELYDVSDSVPPVQQSLLGPVAFEEDTDQWGTVVSGWAPIWGSSGTAEAVLGVDIDASKIGELPSGTFVPIYVFLALFGLFLLFRLPGFSKSPLYALWSIINTRKFFFSVLFALELALLSGLLLYLYTFHIIKQQTGERLMAIAATAALQIDAKDLENLRFARDMKRPEYQKVFKQLNAIRQQNPDIKFAYIFRPTMQKGIWEFVADADSNYTLPFYTFDFNKDGVMTETDENVAPGVAYYVEFSSPTLAREGIVKPTFEKDFVFDQWGTFITASAPIRNVDGKGVAILGLDMVVDSFVNMIFLRFIIVGLTTCSIVFIVTFIVTYFLGVRLRKVYKEF